MVAQHLLDSVLALPPSEQVELIDRVRQHLRNAAWPLTDAQRSLLDARLDQLAADPDGGLPWGEVEAKIRSTLGDR